MGIMTIVSLAFLALVWQKYSGWLKTKSSAPLSVETIRRDPARAVLGFSQFQLLCDFIENPRPSTSRV